MNTKRVKQNRAWGLELIGVLSLLKESLILKALFKQADVTLVFTKAIGICVSLKCVDFFPYLIKASYILGVPFVKNVVCANHHICAPHLILSASKQTSASMGYHLLGLLSTQVSPGILTAKPRD